MSSYPEIPEPSYKEMSQMLLKENPATEGKRRKTAILALAIGILIVLALRAAWDHGIIAFVAVNIWNMLCRLAADWWSFLYPLFH